MLTTISEFGNSGVHLILDGEDNNGMIASNGCDALY